MCNCFISNFVSIHTIICVLNISRKLGFYERAMLICVFILCTLREKSLENGETGRSWKRVKGARGGVQGFLNDAVSLLTSAHSYIYPKGWHTWKRRGRIGVDVQLRLVSYTYILTQGGRLYRRGNNATGVPERFHYTASRGITSQDISPRSTPTGVKFRVTGPSRMKDEPSVWRPYTGEALPWATPLEGERFRDEQGRKLKQPTTLGQGIAMRRRKMADGLVAIANTKALFNNATGSNAVSDSCLFSLEATERDAWRTQQYATDVVYFQLFCS